MSDDAAAAEAAREYAAAYATHYSERDLAAALNLYERIMATHPKAREAAYSRAQVQNIVETVVPKEELLEALLKLARAHLAPALAAPSRARPAAAPAAEPAS